GTVVAAYLPGPVREFLRDLPGAMTLVLAMSVSAVVLELVVGLTFLKPRYRRDAFLLGLLLHVGMVLGVQPSVRIELIGFALLMFAAYLPALGVMNIERVVVWDDSCTSCAAWVRWFRRLDWLGALTFVASGDGEVLERYGLTREEADTSMWVFGGEERAGGFRAVIEVLEQLPVSFLWARARRLPVGGAGGERMYRRQAARRHCAVG